MHVRRGLGALAIAVALLPLSGCADDDSTADPPEPTSSGSPSPTATQTPSGSVEPELPVAATRRTRAGAIAFTKHYWAMVDYAQASGDPASLKALASDACTTCAGGVAALKKIHDGGGKIVGPPSRVVHPEASVADRGPAASRFVTAHVRHSLKVGSSSEYYGTGDPRNKRWGAGTSKHIFTLVWRPEARTWLLAGWQIL